MAPRPSIGVTRREFVAQSDKLRALITHVDVLAPEYRQMLAEMIALQAFYLFESAIEEIAAKLLCGARYNDGAVPVLHHAAASIDAALLAMRTVGRTRPKGILKWNKAREINGNMRHVLAPTDNFCTACRNHSARLNEIRIVRNHIAHGNKGTKAEFARVVERRLGARPQRLPRPGIFVLREFTPGVPLLIEFVATLGAIITDVGRF